MAETQTNTPAFLDFLAVCRALGLKPGRAARTFLWRNARLGLAPSPYKIGPNKIAWRATDIEAFIASRKAVLYAKETA